MKERERAREVTSEPTDSNGWPLSFWRLLGRVDDAFDVGRTAMKLRASPEVLRVYQSNRGERPQF